MDMSTMTMVGTAVAVLILAAVVALVVMGSVRWVARGGGPGEHDDSTG